MGKKNSKDFIPVKYDMANPNNISINPDLWEYEGMQDLFNEIIMENKIKTYGTYAVIGVIGLIILYI